LTILYCITRPDTAGGAEIHVADMAEWLIGNGHCVKVRVGGEGPYCEELRRRSIPYRACPSLLRNISLRHEIQAIRELRGILRKESPDLISLHSAKAGVIGRIAALGLPCMVVITAHGWSFTEGIKKRRAFVFRFLEKFMAHIADRIITVSEYDRNLALRFGVGRADSIVSIHNAMRDVDERANAGEMNVRVRIAMVARLDHRKQHSTLFRALS
jgi:glycosyltransferase involved in cell wall biosynthesis